MLRLNGKYGKKGSDGLVKPAGNCYFEGLGPCVIFPAGASRERHSVTNLLSWIWVTIAVVLLFGAAVFVHEFGHFLVARWCGLKVEGFSIGFGPKLFGWTRHGIDYAWRLIPAGGFVKLPQMVTSETLEGKAEGGETLPPASPEAKILVAVAGPVMNAIFAFALATLLYFVGLPIRVNPAVIGGVRPDSAEAKLGIRPGDRVVALNGKPVKSWEDLQMSVAMAPTNQFAVTMERGQEKSTYVLTAQVNEQLGLKLLDLEPEDHPVVDEVKPGSAAAEAGVKKGDEVLSFAGAPIVGQEQLVTLIKDSGGKASKMEVRRGQERLALTVTPRVEPGTKIGRLGFVIGPSTLSVYTVQKPGPLPWVLVGEVCQNTFDTLRALMHPKKTGVGVSDLSGPPGILAALAVELKADLRLGLRFMVLLNISLAILNLMPLPVLDGGHIAMAILEKLRGRPLSPRVQESATTIFAVLLISFMLYVSYNDVVRRLPLFRTMFHQQVQIEDGGSNAPGK